MSGEQALPMATFVARSFSAMNGTSPCGGRNAVFGAALIRPLVAWCERLLFALRRRACRTRFGCSVGSPLRNGSVRSPAAFVRTAGFRSAGSQPGGEGLAGPLPSIRPGLFAGPWRDDLTEAVPRRAVLCRPGQLYAGGVPRAVSIAACGPWRGGLTDRFGLCDLPERASCLSCVRRSIGCAVRLRRAARKPLLPVFC